MPFVKESSSKASYIYLPLRCFSSCSQAVVSYGQLSKCSSKWSRIKSKHYFLIFLCRMDQWAYNCVWVHRMPLTFIDYASHAHKKEKCLQCMQAVTGIEGLTFHGLSRSSRSSSSLTSYVCWTCLEIMELRTENELLTSVEISPRPVQRKHSSCDQLR